jgi:hypothetical protein
MRQPVTRQLVGRQTAVQATEFATGATAGYLLVASVWALHPTLWVLGLVTAAVIAASAGVESRFGSRVTGLVVGLVPSVMVAAGLLATLSVVVKHLN